MKKILLIALLLIPFLGFSQTTKPIEGFLGIKFGSSEADVIAAMKAKGASVFKEEKKGNNIDYIYFKNVTLGHRESDALMARFTDDKVYQVSFLFKADEDPKTIEYYNNLISDINDIYGPGKQSRIFRTTFSDGDGYELTAIQTGNADYYTIWKSDNGNSIQAIINAKLLIFLMYIDGPLSDAVAAKQKAAEKADY